MQLAVKMTLKPEAVWQGFSLPSAFEANKVATAVATQILFHILLPAGLGYAGAPDIEPSVELYAVYDE